MVATVFIVSKDTSSPLKPGFSFPFRKPGCFEGKWNAMKVKMFQFSSLNFLPDRRKIKHTKICPRNDNRLLNEQQFIIQSIWLLLEMWGIFIFLLISESHQGNVSVWWNLKKKFRLKNIQLLRIYDGSHVRKFIYWIEHSSICIFEDSHLQKVIAPCEDDTSWSTMLILHHIYLLPDKFWQYWLENLQKWLICTAQKRIITQMLIKNKPYVLAILYLQCPFFNNIQTNIWALHELNSPFSLTNFRFAWVLVMDPLRFCSWIDWSLSAAAQSSFLSCLPVRVSLFRVMLYLGRGLMYVWSMWVRGR